MSSAFALQYKPHVRQEGFHLPSPPPSTDTPPPSAHGNNNSIFGTGHGGFGGGGMDFNDELASLINPQSNERSTGSSNGPDDYRPPPHTHNIFDISAPSQHTHHQVHHGSASSTSSSFPSHFSLPSAGGSNNNNGGGGGSNGSGSPDHHAHHPQPGPQYHFNSTLPALNSSMRYDPHPPGPSAYIPSPSSFRSPSPHGPHGSRSRSRSRPPSSHLATPAGGPTRTTRARRNGSLSSTSPPPRPVPQAIVIPSSHGGANGSRGSPYQQNWFGTSVNGWVYLALCLSPPRAFPYSSRFRIGSSSSSPAFPASPSCVPRSFRAREGETDFHPPAHHPAHGHSQTPGPDSLPSLSSLPSLPSLSSLSSISSLSSLNNSNSMNINNMNSMHTHGHGLGSPHLGPGSPHTLNSPHGFGNPNPNPNGGGGPAQYQLSPHNGHNMYSPSNGNGNGYGGSPVDAKFPPHLGMGVGMGGMGVGVGVGIPASLNSLNSLSSLNGHHAHHGSLASNGISSASLGSSVGLGGGESKATLLAHEKRRRRRESHNAVERRRRDNINEKISELATLIPECLLEGAQPNQSSATGGQSPGSADDALLSPTLGGGGSAGEWPLVLPGTKKEAADDDGKDGKEGGVVKANKGMILRKSVEYIRYLQQLVTAQGARNRELEEQLKGFRGSSGSASPPPSSGLPLPLPSSSSSSVGAGAASTSASAGGMGMDFGGVGDGWGAGLLASMPEEEGMSMGMGGMDGMGMDVDAGSGGSGSLGSNLGAGEDEEKRGRRAKRASSGLANGGAEKGGESKAKAGAKGRKAKKVQVDEEEDEGSELSEDGMDV
ncbi:helix-loop-helix DNA-binding domain-containing protein [Mycena galericulata]|nr:helix-loop-helix DNA-binding domain-containing protein [Mycena galericulata]